MIIKNLEVPEYSSTIDYNTTKNDFPIYTTTDHIVDFNVDPQLNPSLEELYSNVPIVNIAIQIDNLTKVLDISSVHNIYNNDPLHTYQIIKSVEAEILKKIKALKLNNITEELLITKLNKQVEKSIKMIIDNCIGIKAGLCQTCPVKLNCLAK